MPQLTLLLTILFLMPTVSSSEPAITEYEVLPDEGDEGFSYSPAEYAFFKCKLSGFDINTMAVGWSFNGQVFADASELNGMLNLRANVDDIFGFDTATNLNTGFALRKMGDDEDLVYEAMLDLVIENWRYNGDYQCSICERNSDGRCVGGLPFEVDSTPLRLNVKYFPPDSEGENYPQIESTPPMVDTETTVSCFSLPGYPTVDVTLVEIRGAEETQVSGSLIEPETPGNLLFYNYTYTPTMDDSDIVFKCTIENSFESGGTLETNSRSAQMDPLELVSLPVVELSGPETVKVNSSLTLTCTATSPTSHDLGDYQWSAEPSLPESRYSQSGGTLTITAVQQDDDGTIISCGVTDSKEMEGSDSYTIDAIPPKDPLLEDPPIALIVVGSVVGFILILVAIAACVFCCRKKRTEKSKHQYSNHSANVTTKQNRHPDHKSANGLPTISSTVAGQQQRTPLPPYDPRDYPVNGDLQKRPVDEIDDFARYPEYERSLSQDQFYPGDERSPDYHYNTGYDEGRGDYPSGYEDLQVGDFTQPTDRQPAYGQGYDDGYPDQKDPLGYDDYAYNPPRDGYEYDDRPYVGEGTAYDDGYVGPYPDDIPPRSPRDNGYNDGYYPPEQQPHLNQDGYGDPNLPLPYDDGYPRDQGDMYQKEDPNYPYDYEPFGERDQVPDGQEADYQGDPYNESYNPPIVDDRLPDGGVQSRDPFYDLHDMKPTGGEFDDPQLYPSNAPALDQYDPSYV